MNPLLKKRLTIEYTKTIDFIGKQLNFVRIYFVNEIHNAFNCIVVFIKHSIENQVPRSWISKFSFGEILEDKVMSIDKVHVTKSAEYSSNKL